MPVSAIRRFLQLEAAGGILLLIGAAAALIVANVPMLAQAYNALLALPIEVRLGPLELNKNLLLVINDGLMAVFFLLVALEIKREFLEGELSNVRQVILPAVAALGGLACPALIYAATNWGDAVALRGWAIPAATDIAFSLGVLSLLGTRVPLSLKVFLTTLAVLDDLAAILIIALFYTEQLSLTALTWAVVGPLALIVINRAGVRSLGAYVLVGVFMWVCVLKSGVHATLAGVALGLAIPAANAGEHGSLLHRLEHALHPWVAYGILPLFAFANAGVRLAGLSASAFVGSVPLGIAAGLLIGKTLGVFGFAGALIKTGAARLPAGANWGALLGLAMLAGIGFTMSLFIGTLAFEGQDAELAAGVRIGVLSGSLAAAGLGLLMLHLSLRDVQRSA